MNRFHEIQDAAAIIASKGVYKQVKIFMRGEYLYAQYGGGFIRLYEKGTSLPNIRLEEYELPDTYKVLVGEHGKLIVNSLTPSIEHSPIENEPDPRKRRELRRELSKS